eukprot:TRINITY_DN17126_c0_g1_i1.p1 TRINITY_DN17126_c0_g1~~TRINITY_DN17126_c0_g1_i1.p1  ORF type:complete len:266 (+),score=72.93 TRINITY_DN17126_c0_g1_i1:27-800(+)
MEHYVEGKVVVITGGSSGLGLETARILLRMGASVAITGRAEDRLAAAEHELGAVLTAAKAEQPQWRNELLAVQADACDTHSWDTLLPAVLARFGRIDVFIFNHGAGGKLAPITEVSDEFIDEFMNINVISAMKGARRVLPIMKKQGSGHIINVASVCADYAWPGFPVYTVAKTGLVAFTRCLQQEMKEWGGKASTFVPAAHRTNFSKSMGNRPVSTDFPDAKDFARTVVQMVDVPPNCVVEETTIWGVNQLKGIVNY